MTNADRIRAMTDEGLTTVMYNHSCMLCPIVDCDGRMEIGADACWHRWLDWLRQEAEK